MIDMHTHVLPCIDDGANSVETSQTLLRMAHDQGIQEIVFTPHYYGDVSLDEFLERRQTAYETIQATLPQGMRVRLGAEVYFSGLQSTNYDELAHLKIQNTNCVMLELPFLTVWPKCLFSNLEKCIQEMECTPIIAHVERYVEVLKDPTLLNRLLELGCLFQINTSAFLKKHTKSLALAMLKNGYVHCFGTDAHDAEIRKPNYTQAKSVVEELGLLAEWENVQATMQRILDGKPISLRVKKSIKKFFGRYH